MIRVILVDDHALFRMGIKETFNAKYPDIEVVGEAANGKELFNLLETTPTDLVFLDVNLPDMRGNEIASGLRKDYPEIKILAVSAENTEKTVKEMLEAGIDGFISKQKGDANELAEAIRSVMSGIEFFGRDISSIIFSIYVAKKKTTSVTEEFTEKEKEILLLSKDGLMGKEIAERLNVSINTINTHKRRIFEKLGINTTLEAVHYALRKGIIRVEN